MNFKDLGISEPLVQVLKKSGITTPTPIQEECIPLIKDYKDWIKSVDDVDQALADHQKDYQAKYYNGEYTIVLGAGKGKELTGTLKASYCVSSKEIKKKSFFAELFS